MIVGAQRWIVDLAEADPADVDRLGGKGASLAAMRREGIPVPPAFVVPTDLCRRLGAEGEVPERAWDDVQEGIAALEDEVGRRFGDPAAPLLVSVRSGAPVSMPGMMDTILNVGLGRGQLPGLAAMTGDEAFAWDSYVRLLKMFASSVRGVSAATLAAAKVGEAPGERLPRLRWLADRYLAAIESGSGAPFPQRPEVQLRESVEAVLRSWSSARARRYRRHHGIDDELGTAVVVQAMVFGNLDERSGSGVAFTRDPATGEPGLYGDFLSLAQGEDVVNGGSGVDPISSFVDRQPVVGTELERVGAALEGRYRDMCDIEFTVESGRLWILQARVGQRTAAAEVRIALDLLAAGTIEIEEALRRVSPAALARPMLTALRPTAGAATLGRGIGASPGAACGVLVTSSRQAEERAAAGEEAILVSEDTSPEDIGGFIAARGVVTARGGRASHAAVVARGMNRPAVCSVEGLRVEAGGARFGEEYVAVGEPISLDGASGEVHAGRVPVVHPPEHPEVGMLLCACDARRRVPVLSDTALPWSDGVFDSRHAVECETSDRLAELCAAGAQRIVVDPARAADPVGMLEAAASAAERVFLRIGDGWPAQASRLPAGRWAGLVADGDGRAARLLAATVEVPGHDGAASNFHSPGTEI